jgi:hypothetical protein
MIGELSKRIPHESLSTRWQIEGSFQMRKRKTAVPSCVVGFASRGARWTPLPGDNIHARTDSACNHRPSPKMHRQRACGVHVSIGEASVG